MSEEMNVFNSETSAPWNLYLNEGRRTRTWIDSSWQLLWNLTHSYSHAYAFDIFEGTLKYWRDTHTHSHCLFCKDFANNFFSYTCKSFFNYNRLHNATWKTSSIKVYTFSVQQNTPKHNSLIGSFCYGKDIHEEMQRLWPSNFKLSQLDQDTLSFAHQSLYHSLLSFLCFI